jgi:hypothetical protein
MGRSGDRYELDIPEFNWNVGADAMRQDAHTSPTARIKVMSWQVSGRGLGKPVLPGEYSTQEQGFFFEPKRWL